MEDDGSSSTALIDEGMDATTADPNQGVVVESAVTTERDNNHNNGGDDDEEEEDDGDENDDDMDQGNVDNEGETTVSGKKRSRSTIKDEDGVGGIGANDEEMVDEKVRTGEVDGDETTKQNLEDTAGGVTANETTTTTDEDEKMVVTGDTDDTPPSASIVSATPTTTASTATTSTGATVSSLSSATTIPASNISVSAASVAAAAQLAASMGWTGLSSLLSATALSSSGGVTNSTGSTTGSGASSSTTTTATGSSSSSSSTVSAGTLPTVEQVFVAATRAVNESPPFCHLSKTDSAPQLKIINSECAIAEPTTDDNTTTTSNNNNNTASSVSPIPTTTTTTTTTATMINDRLACKGGMRGYRMTRATHGVGPSGGNYYYEVLIQSPPSVSEIVNSLPPNVRMGKKLQHELQYALLLEQQQQQQQQQMEEEEEENKRKRAKKDIDDDVAATAAAPTDTTDGEGDASTGIGGDGTESTKENDESATRSGGNTDNTNNNGGGPSRPPNKKSNTTSTSTTTTTTTTTTNSSFGAHVRLGWSMRTGDLQAPVGYDKWSYGIRDIGGSTLHCSKRNDHWGGEGFGPGDVIGCAISMIPGGGAGVMNNSSSNSNSGKDGTTTASGAPSSSGQIGPSGSATHSGQQQQQGQQPQNHIRFFKNGVPMGEFVISKGRREGGAAFFIPDGVYYPAVSLYMGATVKVNFGPHFVCPPKKLPTGMKVQPMSNLCKAPISVDDAIVKVMKDRSFRKADMQQRFLDLVKVESQVLQDAYRGHRSKHVQDVYQERKRRNLKTEDLESDDYFTV